MADLLFAQGMSPGIPGMPKTMFGKKQDDRDISGPTLSATNETVVDIRIVGNSTIPTSQILNQLQTRVNRPFDPALVQRDVRKLAARGWFVDVQPSYEQAPNGRIVIFKVVERPVIRYVAYLGTTFRYKKLDKETDLKAGGPVDPYAVQEARRRLVDFYHRNGYNNAQVTIYEGDKPTDHGVTFVINEGTAQKIWKVEFIGNEFIESRRLKTKIESKPPMLMLFKGYVDREQIEADVNKLTAFYRSYGYFDAKVGRQYDFDEKNKWMTLRFVIHEGLRYQVENVAFIGNKIISSDSLTMGVDLKPDSNSGPPLEKMWHKISPLPPGPRPFEQDKMNADVAWLKELYGSQGYIFADIQAEPIFLETPGRVKLMYHISEGRRWRVGNIYVHINGDNPHTKIQTALNRLSFRSGQIADIREIRASERRLQASGLFMADPVHGVMPKITYHIPELQKSQMAKGGENGFRGQSPDSTSSAANNSNGGMELLPAPGLPVVVNDSQESPPLIAPPGTYATTAPPRRQQTYKIEAPQEPKPTDEPPADIEIFLDDTAAAATVAPPPSESPSAQRYEARRPPYDDYSDSANQYATPVASNSPVTYPEPRPSVYTGNQPAASTPSRAYQGIAIRYQSPYPDVAAQGYATTPVNGTNPASSATPTTAAPSAATRYTAPAYGGQSVGATGPDAAPAGTNSYPVRQAAITEPQIPPGGPAPVVAPPYSAPVFAPPPINSQPVETLPAPAYAPPPQYAPAPQPGPAPVYGPAPPYGPPPGVLGPDPRVGPIPPLPTSPYPADSFTPMSTDPPVDMDVVVSEAQTGRLMLGVAVNSDAGLVGQILLDEQSFDITRPPTSWEDFWSGRAWRGGGERLRIEAAPGTQVQRYLISFTEPYVFNSPYSLGLSGSFFDRKYRDWDEQRVGGRVSLGYQWVENDLSTGISYRGEDVEVSNISNPALPELTEVLGHNAVHGFKWTVANDTRDSAFLATKGHFLQLELEEVVGSFQYPRAIIDARQYILLNERPDYSGRHVLTLSSRVGFSGNDTPVYDRFFAGGFSSLRGFDFRGASPVVSNAQVGGNFEFINTVEYLFPLTADDMIHGVAFFDFGTVNENVALKNFRAAPGIGLRITVPAMGPAPIALDFAFPVAKIDTDQTQVFSFNVGLQR
jgi:outer membrane protein insertion porin family